MTRKRILFVDDEAAIVSSFEKLFRRERERWEVVIATSGAQALERLAAEPVDVIVSDVRMPGLDGPALLARVKADFPATTRILLSGEADRAAVLRALPVAHQYLGKPCDPQLLKATIDRTYEMHRLLEDPSLRRFVSDLQQLPSIPRTYNALTAAAADPRAGLADFARIIEGDPSMSLKVLQLVNSAYFGSSQRIATIQRAVSYLGLQVLRDLTLTTRVFSADELAIEGFSFEGLQARSLRTARLAKQLLPDAKLGDEAFTAALLHDIGQIVLAVGMRSRFAAIIRDAHASGRPQHVVEREHLGVSHAEIGAYLLGVWGLPFSIVESVANHHRPSAVTDGSCEVLAAVHAAGVLTPDVGAPANARDELDSAFLVRVGFGGQIERWRALGEESQRKLREVA